MRSASVVETATAPKLHRTSRFGPQSLTSAQALGGRVPIEMKRYPFTRPIIEYAPYDMGGVYVLWDGDEAIYIGRTGGAHDIRACLLEHLDGMRGDCTRTA